MEIPVEISTEEELTFKLNGLFDKAGFNSFGRIQMRVGRFFLDDGRVIFVTQQREKETPWVIANEIEVMTPGDRIKVACAAWVSNEPGIESDLGLDLEALLESAAGISLEEEENE